MAASEEVDVLVIGAGLSGLAFASFFLEIHPKANLLLVEQASDVGGVWSASRMFESFWTQSSISLSGFSRPPFQVPPGVTNNYNLYHAKYMTEYLEKFVTYHSFEGRTLLDRIRFDRCVSSVVKQSSEDDQTRWQVTCSPSGKSQTDKKEETISAKKIVIATGHTSIPYMPQLPSRDAFRGKIVHHKDYGQFCKTKDGSLPDVTTDPPAASSSPKHIVVLGAGKSAADLVYDSIKRGGDQVRVSWLIRKQGSEGPAIFLPAADKHYDNSLTRSMIRWNNIFNPSSFMSSWHWPLVHLIHSTSRGRAYVDERREKARLGCVALGRYGDREGALPDFHLLRPDDAHSPFWCTGPLGLTQHDDFWDLVSSKVYVYRNDIQALAEDGILLDDGRKVLADVILCGTGWRSDYPFLSSELQSDLGLPVPSNTLRKQKNENEENGNHQQEKREEEFSQESWTELLDAADKKVLRQFPSLENPPPGFRRPTKSNPTQLYNCVAPLSDMHDQTGKYGKHGKPGGRKSGGRSIVFLGHCDTSSSFRVAEAQGIWATAYLDGNLPLPTVEKAREELAYMNAFSRRRYPSRGQKGDNIFFEALWYTDKLMDDLGLSSHRSHRSWWANWTEPVRADDFRDVPGEYRRRFGIEST